MKPFQRSWLKFIEIDGVKYEDDNGWWLVRQSNTEDALIICIEGRNPEEFEKIRLYLQEKLNIHALNLPIKEP